MKHCLIDGCLNLDTIRGVALEKIAGVSCNIKDVKSQTFTLFVPNENTYISSDTRRLNFILDV